MLCIVIVVILDGACCSTYTVLGWATRVGRNERWPRTGCSSLLSTTQSSRNFELSPYVEWRSESFFLCDGSTTSCRFCCFSGWRGQTETQGVLFKDSVDNLKNDKSGAGSLSDIGLSGLSLWIFCSWVCVDIMFFLCLSGIPQGFLTPQNRHAARYKTDWLC